MKQISTDWYDDRRHQMLKHMQIGFVSEVLPSIRNTGSYTRKEEGTNRYVLIDEDPDEADTNERAWRWTQVALCSRKLYNQQVSRRDHVYWIRRPQNIVVLQEETTMLRGSQQRTTRFSANMHSRRAYRCISNRIQEPWRNKRIKRWAKAISK